MVFEMNPNSILNWVFNDGLIVHFTSFVSLKCTSLVLETKKKADMVTWFDRFLPVRADATRINTCAFLWTFASVSQHLKVQIGFPMVSARETPRAREIVSFPRHGCSSTPWNPPSPRRQPMEAPTASKMLRSLSLLVLGWVTFHHSRNDGFCTVPILF
jgi:hypothetical protein